jgi:hypothetical protein
MIKYALICGADHTFEGWFGSSADYEAQHAQGLLGCPVCGATDVRKAIMAPRVVTSEHRVAAADEQKARILAARAHIAQTFTYVGDGFADEVRAMHTGEAEERPVYGEVSLADAKALLDDGVAIAPLPEMLSPRQPIKH